VDEGGETGYDKGVFSQVVLIQLPQLLIS
jgi:hypothetical protein